MHTEIGGAPQNGSPAPPYTADEVAALTRLAKPTVYEQARRDPERWGLLRFGRAVRFARERIDRLVTGGA